jgi:hypothetical protein
MSNPFSGIPDPEPPRPIRRPSQPGPVQEVIRAMQESLRAKLPGAEGALRRAQRVAKDAFWQARRVAKDGVWRAQRFGQDLWLRGKRKPRTVGLIGGAVALTLVGAYALSASGAGRSLCPPSDRKAPKFALLMDRVPHLAAGSVVEIHYDVCGLSSGAAYRGRVQLTQQRPTGKKKKSAKPKPLVFSFKDQVDGVATRRQQQLDLGAMRPGAYTLELTVADKQGRERKRVQKVLIKAR